VLSLIAHVNVVSGLRAGACRLCCFGIFVCFCCFRVNVGQSFADRRWFFSTVPLALGSRAPRSIYWQCSVLAVLRACGPGLYLGFRSARDTHQISTSAGPAGGGRRLILSGAPPIYSSWLCHPLPVGLKAERRRVCDTKKYVTRHHMVRARCTTTKE
jgi:hypothetical protein